MDGARNRGRVGGRYDLLRVIDHGGYAIVYEGLDGRLNRTVALKTVLPDHPDPAAAPRLVREARVMASITHPNVCGVSDMGTLDDGRPFFVMDRLEGETLRSVLNRELVLDAELAIDLTVELLAALHAVHVMGSVHRDVKPENVFLAHRSGCRPAVKLIDFGCCGPMATRESEVCLTRDYHVVGTPPYMAPEQAAGSRLFHAGTDIFAAALILLESVTGFEPQAPSRSKGVETYPRLSQFRSDLPNALEAILARALSPDPRQRYRSTIAFAKDLVAVRPLVRVEGATSVAIASNAAPPAFGGSAPPRIVTEPRTQPAMPAVHLESSGDDATAESRATQIPPTRRSSAPPAAGAYSHHLDDPTLEHPRPVKTEPKAARDAIRDADPDGATPLSAMRFPLDLRL
jgi:serine/threonine-protein kinase